MIFKKKLIRNNLIDNKFKEKNEIKFRSLTVQDVNYNGKYYLRIDGILLENSKKITVVLRDIDIFFDVELRNNREKEELLQKMNNIDIK